MFSFIRGSVMNLRAGQNRDKVNRGLGRGCENQLVVLGAVLILWLRVPAFEGECAYCERNREAIT